MSSGIRSPAQAVCLWIWSPCPPPCPVSRGHRVDVVLLAQHPTPTFWMPWLIPLTWFMFSYDLFFFFNFTILYCFCHISTWIHHRNTCVPHPEPSSLPVPSLWVIPVWNCIFTTCLVCWQLKVERIWTHIHCVCMCVCLKGGWEQLNMGNSS